jgi:hypothetical protein
MSEQDKTAKPAPAGFFPPPDLTDLVKAVQGLTAHVQKLTTVVAPPPRGDEAVRRHFDTWFTDLGGRMGVRRGTPVPSITVGSPGGAPQ